MAEGIFEQIMEEAIEAGISPRKTQESLRWYRRKIKGLGQVVRPGHIVSESHRSTTDIEYGKMYHFYYRPKGIDTLPYYDKFPLCFPLKRVKNGFYGLNLHYLPLNLRVKFMSELYSITNNKKFDDSTRLIMTYRMLNNSVRFRYFRPCIKRYIRKQIRSDFIEIYPPEWSIALFLPTELFQLASKQQVWEDSKRKIK